MSSFDGRQQMTIERGGGGMKFRGSTTGIGDQAWSSWRTVIDDDNIESQSVNFANTADNANTVGGISVDRIVYGEGPNGKSTYNGNANVSDSSNASGFYFHNDATGMPPGWHTWISARADSWSGADGYGFQLANSFWNGDLRHRRQTSGTWHAWTTIVSSANVGSYALPIGGGTLTGELNGTSSVFSSTVTASDFIGSSDKRLKKEIKSLKVKEIKSEYKTFVFKSDKTNQKRTGVIAQELELNHPEFVRTDEKGMKSVSYGDLHSAEIAYLKAKNKELENKLELIMNKLGL